MKLQHAMASIVENSPTVAREVVAAAHYYIVQARRMPMAAVGKQRSDEFSAPPHRGIVPQGLR
jgi:hypothetical protein